MQRKAISLICKFSLLAFVIVLSSCDKKSRQENIELAKQFRLIDSVSISGKTDSVLKLLATLRPKINTSNPLISKYYCFVSQAYADKPALMNVYADSALAFFNTEGRKTQYPDEYLKTLLNKGDACLKAKKYISALNYYYIGQKMLAAGKCDNGDLAAKMGSIYYDQKNFALAAKYLSESCRQLEQCRLGLTQEKLFILSQGALNNAGCAYERAGLLDSALYYYMRDIAVIDKADSDKASTEHYLKAARIVVYDNLGGLYLKKGDLTKSKKYLIACSTMPYEDTEGLLITSLLKLAELYVKTGEAGKEIEALNKCRLLLNKFSRSYSESLIKWNKLYSEYLFKQKQPDKAFSYQTNYIRLRDSVDNNSSDLYRLDVERELNTIQQQNELIDLTQKNKIKKTYILGIGIIALLSVVIILLVNRNLKRAQKSHQEAKLYNQQLQNTLAELERVNKNYIRIMRVMAHDLRNPLSGMTGLAAMLLGEDEFSEEHKHMLKLIETTGTHSMEMINELLKTGLADENEQIAKQTLDLKELLYDSVELLQFKAKDKDQHLVFESDSEPIMASVNHEKIWRVFNNIIVNAIKFSHPSSTIKVSIHRRQKSVLVSIADSGVGIPDRDKHNIFEMFTPAKKAGTNGEQPFGLGLSISKKIIEKHGGKIWFESTVGVGTTFYIELPGMN